MQLFFHVSHKNQVICLENKKYGMCYIHRPRYVCNSTISSVKNGLWKKNYINSVYQYAKEVLTRLKLFQKQLRRILQLQIKVCYFFCLFFDFFRSVPSSTQPLLKLNVRLVPLIFADKKRSETINRSISSNQ